MLKTLPTIMPNPHCEDITVYEFAIDEVFFTKIMGDIQAAVLKVCDSCGPCEEGYDKQEGWGYFLTKAPTLGYTQVNIATEGGQRLLRINLWNQLEGDDRFDGTLPRTASSPHQWLDALEVIKHLMKVEPIRHVN